MAAAFPVGKIPERKATYDHPITPGQVRGDIGEEVRRRLWQCVFVWLVAEEKSDPSTMWWSLLLKPHGTVVSSKG